MKILFKPVEINATFEINNCVPMGIEEKQAVAVFYILEHKINHKGGFPHPWLSEDIQPASPLGITNGYWFSCLVIISNFDKSICGTRPGILCSIISRRIRTGEKFSKAGIQPYNI